MSVLARLRSFLTTASRQKRYEDALDEEVRFHLEAYAADLVRSGVPAREARRRAHVHFGSREQVKDACRRARGLRVVEALERVVVNVRLAVRTLRKTPVATGAAALSLALAIGANAAIYSLYYQHMLAPLPVAQPERLVNLEAPGPKPGSVFCNDAGGCDEVFSYPMYRDLQREQNAFTDIAAHQTDRAHLSYGGLTASVWASCVSGSYFPTLRLSPAAGRLFGREVDEPIGGHPVAVLGHDFWVSDLAGAPDVVGDVLSVNGRPLTIVGVAPPGFRGTTSLLLPSVYVPLTMCGAPASDRATAHRERFQDRRAYWIYLFARLKPVVSLSQARASLEPRYRSILAEVEAPLQAGLSDASRTDFVTKSLVLRDGRRGQSQLHDNRGVGVAFLLLLGVTIGVVLVACANVANLLLARAATRRAEMAVRLSLGGSRRHLLAQLLTESCLLALLGGVSALGVAYGTLRFIGALIPTEAAGIVSLTLDPIVVPFVSTLSVGAGLLLGILPALHATRAGLASAAPNDAEPRSANRVHEGFVAAQFALLMVLLTTTGLIIQSHQNNANRSDRGYGVSDVGVFRVAPGLSGYGHARTRVLLEGIANALSAKPGVASVTTGTVNTAAGETEPVEVAVEGFAGGPDADRTTHVSSVGTDYFRTLGIGLLAGRSISDSDTAGTSPVAVVNQAFARKFDLEPNPVGTRFAIGGLDAEPDIEIVGLAGDVRPLPQRPARPIVYLAHRQGEDAGRVWFHVRTASPIDEVLDAVPALVAALDPDLPVTSLMPMTSLARLNEPVASLAVLSASFAIAAALLVAVGLYGVLAYSVASRTREYGLRLALGADATRVLRMVLAPVARVILAGSAFGSLAAWGVERAARAVLYEVEGLPPVVIGAAVAGLVAVAAIAAFVPAHRASRIDPRTALRHL